MIIHHYLLAMKNRTLPICAMIPSRLYRTSDSIASLCAEERTSVLRPRIGARHSSGHLRHNCSLIDFRFSRMSRRECNMLPIA